MTAAILVKFGGHLREEHSDMNASFHDGHSYVHCWRYNRMHYQLKHGDVRIAITTLAILFKLGRCVCEEHSNMPASFHNDSICIRRWR